MTKNLRAYSAEFIGSFILVLFEMVIGAILSAQDLFPVARGLIIFDGPISMISLAKAPMIRFVAWAMILSQSRLAGAAGGWIQRDIISRRILKVQHSRSAKDLPGFKAA